MYIIYSNHCITQNSWGPEKCSSYTEFRVRRCVLDVETKGELYELCDNSSYNCSSYAESIVIIIVHGETGQC